MVSEKSLRLRGRLDRLAVRCPGCQQVWLAPGLAGGDTYACKACGTVLSKRESGASSLRSGAFFTSEHTHSSQFVGASPTVLVAEDSEDARHVLCLELQHRGCRVIEASDGREAVEMALTAHPDLILMDLHMPRLDGLAATERIRAHSDLDAVPIIAVTAFDTYGIREAALEAGCQEYLLKPLGPGALERALRTALPGFDFEFSETRDTLNGHE